MAGTETVREWDGGAIGRLSTPLAVLYPTSKDSRRVVADAGLDAGRIDFEGAATITWFGILLQASTAPGSVEAIIAVARREYPEDEALARAVEPDPALTGARLDVPQPTLDSLPAVEAKVTDVRPLVDRTEAVAFLRSELADVNTTGSGRALLLIGDSGVGKSRLAQSAVQTARESEMVVLQVQCIGQGAEGLLPFRESLAFHFRDPANRQLLSEPSADVEDSAQFLRSFLQAVDAGTAGPRLGGSMGQGTYDGLAGVLLGLSGQRGLCLMVEDLTDADPDTLHFLDYFTGKATPNRVLTISTVKQDLLESQLEDLMDKWQAAGCRVSPVPPLEPADAADLVSSLWTGAPPSDEQIADIVALTGGNPFFIEQFVALRAEDPSAAAVDVPDRVEAVLRRRLRRLDEETMSFLGAAAVALEASHGIDLIAHVAEIDGKSAERLLRRATERHCLTEDAQGAIVFVQELLRRAVYDDLGARARLGMHGRAAEWLEGAGLLLSAAHHYERAGRSEDLVRTALEGADLAEHAGTYRSAIQLYERALPSGDLDLIGPRLAKAYIVVGEWEKAWELLGRLPVEAPEVRLLRSELLFNQSYFDRALDELGLALQAPSVNRLDTLIRLADVNLYLGKLERAGEYAREALAEAPAPNAIARCHGIVGAAAFYGGDIDEGERQYVEAMTVLSSQPLEERDRSVYTTILGNLGYASEVRGHWESAKRLHEEALSKRREVSDARGVLQSLHAVARSDLGLGSIDAALRSLDEARDIASGLGERLEEGKIEHTHALVDLRRGEPAAAVRRAESALRRFDDSRAAFDETHARFTLATAFAANRAPRRALEESAAARVQMELGGFGLLSTLFADLAFTYRERIAAGFLAYAYGDAVGLPWEGLPPTEIDMARAPSLPASEKWPSGATSDDTALTVLVAEHLAASDAPDAAGFLALLAERAPSIQGLGPSTTNAVEHFRRTGEAPTGDGNTNGALMRALPIGWAKPLDRVLERRAWTIELSRATHPGPEACCAACVGSACAAWAIEGAGPALLLDVAREEAAAAAPACGADGRINDMLSGVAAGRWEPNPDSADLDSYETLTRALWCISKEPGLPDALLAAVRIGGDTDTVAALVGGLLGCRLQPDEVRRQVPWSMNVSSPEDALLDRLAAGICDLRVGRAGG